MGKKISMMVFGVAVLGFCMAAVPQGKAEAAGIKCSGSHKHKNEGGNASCSGQMNQGDSMNFTTSSPWWGTPRYSAELTKNISFDYYTVRVKSTDKKCKASNSKSRVKAGMHVATSVNLNY